MSTPKQPEEQHIPITLPERHWVIVLALLEDFIQTKALPTLKDLIAKGAKPEELSEAQVSTTMGPIFARGAIIKELVARGVMKQEADDKLGIDKLMSIVERFKKEQGQ